jgi:hypothetical protein
MSTELIIADGGYTLSLVPDAQRMQTQLLELGAGILDVDDATSNSLAVQAQVEIKTWIKRVEAARKLVKEPILAAGRRLDALAAEHMGPLQREYDRISRLTSWFAEREAARVAAEQAARQAEIDRLAAVEAQRLAAQRAAEAVLVQPAGRPTDEAAARAAQAAEQAAAAATQAVEAVIRSAPAEATRAVGQRVSLVTRWEVTDAPKLYAQYPHWFDLRERRSVIHASVSPTTQIEGLRVWQETVASVRT